MVVEDVVRKLHGAPNGSVHELITCYGVAGIDDLEVRRPCLEDVYLSMVGEWEAARSQSPGREDGP